MVLGETFDHETFRASLARLFTTGEDGALDQAFNATLEVVVPKVCATLMKQGIRPCRCEATGPQKS